MADSYRIFECSSWPELPTVLNELISDIGVRVIEAQASSNQPWDIIRFEIWEDSGRIIGFPALTNFQNRTDVAGAQVICPEIVADIEKIDDSDISDAEYERYIIRIIRKMARALFEAMAFNGTFEFRVYDQDGNQISAT
jgi:hypothetical protein